MVIPSNTSDILFYPQLNGDRIVFITSCLMSMQCLIHVPDTYTSTLMTYCTILDLIILHDRIILISHCLMSIQCLIHVPDTYTSTLMTYCTILDLIILHDKIILISHCLMSMQCLIHVCTWHIHFNTYDLLYYPRLNYTSWQDYSHITLSDLYTMSNTCTWHIHYIQHLWPTVLSST